MHTVRRSILFVAALCVAMLALAGTAGAQGYTDPGDTSDTAGAGAGAGSGNLPTTGSDSFPWVATGVGLVVVGGAFTVAARRRHQANLLKA